MKKLILLFSLLAVTAFGAFTSIPNYVSDNNGLYTLDSKMPESLWALIINANTLELQSRISSPTLNNITISGYLRSTGPLTVSSGRTTTLNGALIANSSSTLKGLTVPIGYTTTLNGPLVVNQVSTFNRALVAKEDSTFNGLTVNSNTTTLLNGPLTVVGVTTNQSAVIIEDDLTVIGVTAVSNLTVTGTLTVDGGTTGVTQGNTFTGDVTVAEGALILENIKQTNSTVGTNSIAMGATATAANNAIAFGGNTVAENYAFALGANAEAKQYSYALGRNAKASGRSAYAVGYRTTASEYCSHAIGAFANAAHTNSYVWAGDVSLSTNNLVSSTTNGQYTVHAANGTRLLGGGVEIEGDLNIGGTLTVTNIDYDFGITNVDYATTAGVANGLSLGVDVTVDNATLTGNVLICSSQTNGNRLGFFRTSNGGNYGTFQIVQNGLPICTNALTVVTNNTTAAIDALRAECEQLRVDIARGNLSYRNLIKALDRYGLIADGWQGTTPMTNWPAQ